MSMFKRLKRKFYYFSVEREREEKKIWIEWFLWFNFVSFVSIRDDIPLKWFSFVMKNTIQIVKCQVQVKEKLVFKFMLTN